MGKALQNEPVTADEVELEAPYTVPRPELELGYQLVRVEHLKAAKRNPRKGSVRDVIESLREFGQHRPVVVQQSTWQVIVGNHLLLAARSLGWDEIDAYVVADDDQQALRRAIADNAVGDKAGWDEAELAAILSEIGPVPGLDTSDVDQLLAKIAPTIEKEQPTYPLVARLNEHYDYVMIFCETETDWVWLQTKLDLRKEKSYKQPHVARSHVITAARFQELLDGS